MREMNHILPNPTTNTREPNGEQARHSLLSASFAFVLSVPKSYRLWLFSPYSAYLVEGHCPAGLPMYFVAFDGQDDPLRGRALPEHEAMPEFLGFLLKRGPLHFPLICWLSEGLDPQ